MSMCQHELQTQKEPIPEVIKKPKYKVIPTFSKGDPTYDCDNKVAKCISNDDASLLMKVLDAYTEDLNKCESARKALIQYMGYEP